MEVANDTVIKKPKRLTSVVWNHFERVRKADICYAVCVHCNKKLSGSSNSGTTHLRNHLMRCLKRFNYDVSQLLSAKKMKKDNTLTIANISYDEGQRKEDFIKPTIVNYEPDHRKEEVFNLQSSWFDQERSRLDLARMIILHGYPLTMVDHVGFNVFVRNLQPLFDVALNNAIEVSCMEIYGKERQKVHDMLSKLRGSVNLTVEMWSSLENSNHISENKSRLINGQVLDVRSAAHVINSVVQDAMEALRVVIQKIRGSIQYVKSSQSIQGKFQEMAQQTGIDSQKNLSPNDFLSSLAAKMKAKFDKYWSKCSLSLAVAAILDPRFKMKLVEYYYSQIYGSTALDRIKEVSDGLKELFNTYTICSTLIDQDSSLPHSSLPGSGNDGRDRLKGFDKFLHETSQSQSAISDLEKYLDEPVFPRNFDFNILNWWRVHTPRYPILSMMARDVLGTPMSTVSRESAFNAGGRVLDSSRSSLAPDTLQALICTQDWLQIQSDDSGPSSSHYALPLYVETN
ncbi:hypothetical protein V6N11_056037 [Hibiscus sabdariffa]|uniref:BED-type domain-containing protein n=1 Tax=Hibiscus sabdariffa TaxID=183260 RepID=A0ABR2T3H9_9ROSI